VQGVKSDFDDRAVLRDAFFKSETGPPGGAKE